MPSITLEEALDFLVGAPLKIFVVVALALGAWGGVSNVGRQRTQAYQLVPIIRDQAAPGDLVVFCPDAIGTDVGPAS